MSTPIYDALKFETQALGTIIQPNPVDAPNRQPWPLEGTRITIKPEPKWRAFIRCLGWWKR